MNNSLVPISAIAASIFLASAAAADRSTGPDQHEQATSPTVTRGAGKGASGERFFSSELKGQLERIAAEHRGMAGISLKNLDTGEEFSVNGNEPFPTASTIKLAVMATVFEQLSSGSGAFKSYYDTVVYDGTTSASGAGFIRNFAPGTKVELKELLHFMITVSDNTATNMLVEWTGGLESVNGWLAQHGFETTRMNATVGSRHIASRQLRDKWGLGVTTPDEMRRLMEMIATGRAGVTSTTDEMLRLLGHQYFDDLIASQVPPMVWIGSKSGAVNESRSDVAIVASPGGTYVLSVYTKENTDRRWSRDNEGEETIRRVSRAVWQHYNPTSSWSPPAGTEQF